jgi:hypothetical protein
MSIKSIGTDLPSHEEPLLTMFASENGLPVFGGGVSYDQHVETYTLLDISVQRHRWFQAAIAAALTRQPGTRGWGQTVVQAFCRDVGISERHFRRLSETYRAWSAILSSGRQGPEVVPDPMNSPLTFTHFYLATKAPNPVTAIVAAHDGGWTVERFGAFVRGQGHSIDGPPRVEGMPRRRFSAEPSAPSRSLAPPLEPTDIRSRGSELEAEVRRRPEFVAALSDITTDEAEAAWLEVRARQLRERARAKRERLDYAVRRVVATEAGDLPKVERCDDGR